MLSDDLEMAVRAQTRRWLVTGAAGFIGSHLVESLLRLGQDVIGLDNLSTGNARNIEDVRVQVGDAAAGRLTFVEDDIRDREVCAAVIRNVDIVLHQAALGSVPRSIHDPLTTHDVNITGMLNMLDAARLEGVPRFIYAASSSTYGDEPNLPKREDRIGLPLSPYAVTKLANEIYSGVYSRTFGYKATGLRYFNVFGPRQDPSGTYAAVIPLWIAAMREGHEIVINGDGSTSRDFCFVANAVQANLRAALAEDDCQGEIYNVAVGARTTLIDLFHLIRAALQKGGVKYDKAPVFGPFRIGDVHHSEANIAKARTLLSYEPTHDVSAGLTDTAIWYLSHAE